MKCRLADCTFRLTALLLLTPLIVLMGTGCDPCQIFGLDCPPAGSIVVVFNEDINNPRLAKITTSKAEMNVWGQRTETGISNVQAIRISFNDGKMIYIQLEFGRPTLVHDEQGLGFAVREYRGDNTARVTFFTPSGSSTDAVVPISSANAKIASSARISLSGLFTQLQRTLCGAIVDADELRLLGCPEGFACLGFDVGLELLMVGVDLMVPQCRQYFADREEIDLTDFPAEIVLMPLSANLAESEPDYVPPPDNGESERFIYWAEVVPQKIRRARMDGSEVTDLVHGTLAANYVAVDSARNKLYWTEADGNRIRRANLDGSGVETIIDGLSTPGAIVIDSGNSKVYWAEGGRIRRANLNGTQRQDVIVISEGFLFQPFPVDFALDISGNRIYWTETGDNAEGRIRRANLNGTGATTLIDLTGQAGSPNPQAIALDLASGKLFWSEDDTRRIMRANLDGSQREQLVTSNCTPFDLVLDLSAGKMYWSETFCSTNRIRVANLNGSSVSNLVTGLQAPTGLALSDEGSLPATDPPPPPPPVCSVSPMSLNFGTVQVGSSVERTFTITNTGGGTLSGSVSESCAHYSIVSGGGSYNLSAGQSRTVTVRFAPTSVGTKNCSIQTGSACTNVSCTGVGDGQLPSGPIAAWGRNDNGQTNIPSPNNGFVAVAGDGLHSLGLKQDGSIVAWGRNNFGQTNVPSPNSGFVAVAGGGDHSLGLKQDGSIVAWGNNWYAQTNVPSPNSGFVAVAGGGHHSIGLKQDGSIVAWGYNNNGQTNVPSPNSGFVAVAAGVWHSMGLKQDGSIVAWGSNGVGQTNVPSPNSAFVAVAAGGEHSLGLKQDGSIVAWGDNLYGQTNVPSPNSGFVTVAGGWYHSLGIRGSP